MRFVYPASLPPHAQAALDAHLSRSPDYHGWDWQIAQLWSDEVSTPGPSFAVVLRAHGDFFRAITLLAGPPDEGAEAEASYTIEEHRPRR